LTTTTSPTAIVAYSNAAPKAVSSDVDPLRAT
jgi:hypothetical protein